MKGLVLKSTGSNYTVKTDDGVLHQCKVKGLFRIKGIETTNPVAVGDYVDIEMLADNEWGFITKIYERKNYIIRKSVKLSKQAHIIAANIDLALVVATPVMPRTSTGFIDRFLATAEAYSIPAGIVFNKSDVYDAEVTEYVNDLRRLYESIGYSCFVVSSVTKNTLGELEAALQNKITLFSGHSGVGKSTLINSLNPGLGLKTSDISTQHKTGKHTTTFAEMHELPEGGYLIDTPGIREFGVIEFNEAEISHYFPEIFAVGKNCKFSNCMHVTEKNCAVIKSIEEGTISESRYASYLSILNNEDIFR